MYNQNSLATGAKWFFFLALVILLGAFALGFNVKDAKWLNREIGSATAKEMNMVTDVERQKAELDLQALRMQTEIQVAQMQQQAEYEAAKQQQELNDSAVAATQWANFQAGLYNTVNYGLLVMMIAIGISLAFVGIYTSVGLYKILNAKSQAIQPGQSQTVVIQKYRHQPSPAAQKARQHERAERERERQAGDNRLNQLFPNSYPIWTAKDDNSEDRQSGQLPLAV
jgi:ABC-type multidrug transport system fused ATPase/permease subunit